MKLFRVIIRDLGPGDHAAALAINQDNTPAVGHLDAAGLERIAHECEIALAADVDGELAAYCLVLGPGADYESVNYQWFARRYDDFAYLDRVAVAEPFRNRGIGAALYAEVERRTTARWFPLEVNIRPRERRLAAVPRSARLRRGRSAGHALRSTRDAARQGPVSRRWLIALPRQPMGENGTVRTCFRPSVPDRAVPAARLTDDREAGPVRPARRNR